MAGDHPTLLRALGLVVDLRVADLTGCARRNWLSARSSSPATAAPAG